MLLYTDQNISIKPGHTQTVKLRIKNHPREFKHGEVICNLKTNNNYGSVQTILLPVRNRKVIVKMENDTSTMWKIPLGGICGSADMRSVSYFHIDRDILHKLMIPHCAFLNEHETETYFNMLMDELHKMYETGTRLNCEVQTPLSPKEVNQSQNSDPYPWLEKDDPRRKMTDEEILRKFLDLRDSDLSHYEKEQLYKMLLKYKKAFSLRDEIGLCPNMEVEQELTDKKPFFIRPFPCSESDKDIIDKEMRKGCLLGILKKGMSSYSSPIMLIPRKHGGIPRIVTNFRHLNSRLVVLQPSIPLVRDAIQILGASGCEVI